ncbi:MAG: nucleoside deaminase [Christensenellaceae bacterium]|nr:nucleoside deaminase [Christensenellaceae bacterium]
MPHNTTHEFFIKEAIKEAVKAQLNDEVPVGAVAVKDGIIIARAHNKKEMLKNATAHAELILINKVLKKTNCKYLDGVTVYVTLEPCPMCAGALLNARVAGLYFGAFDKKAGACGSLLNLLSDSRFNHTCPVTGGILESDCASLLSGFFKKKRV